MAMHEFELSEYAVLAEQKAKQIAVEKETRARMDAEAHRVQEQLAAALFDPYIGKAIRGAYGAPLVLFRGLLTTYGNPTKGLVALRDSYVREHAFTGTDAQWQQLWRGGDGRDQFLHGWEASVAWNSTAARLEATLRRRGKDHHYEKAWPGGDGDLGAQARVLAMALATEIGERLAL